MRRRLLFAGILLGHDCSSIGLRRPVVFRY